MSSKDRLGSFNEQVEFANIITNQLQAELKTRPAKEAADEAAAGEANAAARSKEASDRTAPVCTPGWSANQAATVGPTVEVNTADTAAHETDIPELSLTTAWDSNAILQQRVIADDLFVCGTRMQQHSNVPPSRAKHTSTGSGCAHIEDKGVTNTLSASIQTDGGCGSTCTCGAGANDRGTARTHVGFCQQ